MADSSIEAPPVGKAEASALQRHPARRRRESWRRARCAPHNAALLARATLALPLALACGRAETAAQGPPPLVEVGVVALQPQPVVLTTELPGRTAAFESSEVRPQVSGIIRERLFAEGQLVEAGQTLYQIDPRLYQAAVARARANLASARAASDVAQVRAERFTELARARVASEQEAADAEATARQAAAAVEQARAELDTALINLRFTEVPAPISGRIGRSLATTGALVTSGQADPLATIARLDPIFVDMQQSSAELLALRRALSHEARSPASAEVRLTLEDGTAYEHVGRLEFAEATVDPSTGSVTLRARFQNPDGVLLPGMFVRATVGQAKEAAAILAPQPGVTRDPRGNATALVVGADDKVERRELEVSRTIGSTWLVEKGLAPGDRLIVEGAEKVKEGQPVRPLPATEPRSAKEPSSAAPPGAAAVGGR